MNDFFRFLIGWMVLYVIHANAWDIPSGSYLVLKSPVNAGFGAVFHSVLSALDLYEHGDYAGMTVEFDSGAYFDPDRGDNWWEYYFEPIRLGDVSAQMYEFSYNDVLALMNAGYPMPRERGYELIQRYVKLKPHIQSKINGFISKHFSKYDVIGVHHRGTDKKLEAPLVPFDLTLFHVNWLFTHLPDRKHGRIFVATDDEAFLDYAKKRFPGKVIAASSVRSRNGEPLHYNDAFYRSNYQKGEEALLDLLLLSKCLWLVFPAASAFSMTALKFNPNLPAIPVEGTLR